MCVKVHRKICIILPIKVKMDTKIIVTYKNVKKLSSRQDQ